MPKCLFCLQSDRSFESEEHPISESLGNHTIVLPAGVVCDQCNLGTLSTLDQALAEFFPLKLRRTALGTESKAGKVPVTVFQDGQLRHNGRFAALHGDLGRKTWTEEYRSRKDIRYTIGMATLTGGRPLRGRYAEQVSRALLKVGFGCAWTEQGERLLQPEFNQIRHVILGTTPTRLGYVFVGNQVDERNTGLNVRFDAFGNSEGTAHLRVFADLYGVQMLTDSWAASPPSNLTNLGITATFDRTTR